MAWYEDLSPCDYFGKRYADRLPAVGWLTAGRPYAQGEVSCEVFGKLCELLQDPWEPTHFLGFHTCELCRFTYGGAAIFVTEDERQLRVPASCACNLFVPGDGFLYVSPTAIAHYISAHGYRPPDEYMDAVLRCPPMRSMEYTRAILEHGGDVPRWRELPIAAEELGGSSAS